MTPNGAGVCAQLHRQGGFSVMQDDIGQQFGSHRQLAVVVDQSHLPELVHEMRDTGTRRSHHFGEGLVAEHGRPGGRRGTVLPQPGELQQNARQALLAVIEELVAKVFFEVDVARKEGPNELFIEPRLAGKGAKHGSRLDAEQGGGFQCSGRADAKRLSDQAPFTKEVPAAQNGKDGLFAPGRNHRDFHFAAFNEVNRIRLISLSKDPVALLDCQEGLSGGDALEQQGEMRV
jgi:hypothetical protein